MFSVTLMNILIIICATRINIKVIERRINVRKSLNIVISAFMLWNELPYDIRTVSGYRCSKSKAISFLIAQYL